MLTECPNDLPNPHKNCLREMLNTIICNEHDVRRLNAELRSIEKELHEELDKIQKENAPAAEKCAAEKNALLCESVQDLTAYAKKIANVDEVNHYYAKLSEDLRRRRDNIIMYARQCMIAYNEEKCKFKSFHENTIDYIKRTATLSQDPVVIAKCDYDICEMQKRFVKEVANLKRSESALQSFFKLLKESDPKTYCECCCFKDYDWIPQGKNFEAVDELAKSIKEQMGQVLARAFAQLHMHMPQDSRSFIAAYLMNLDRNEQEIKEKLDLFQGTEPAAAPKELSDPIFRCETNCAETKEVPT